MHFFTLPCHASSPSESSLLQSIAAQASARSPASPPSSPTSKSSKTCAWRGLQSNWRRPRARGPFHVASAATALPPSAPPRPCWGGRRDDRTEKRTIEHEREDMMRMRMRIRIRSRSKCSSCRCSCRRRIERYGSAEGGGRRLHLLILLLDRTTRRAADAPVLVAPAPQHVSYHNKWHVS